jgi:hypothetical protein
MRIVPTPLRGNIPGTALQQEGIQYCMADDLFDCDAFSNDVRIASELQGVPVTTIHSEFSPGAMGDQYAPSAGCNAGRHTCLAAQANR